MAILTAAFLGLATASAASAVTMSEVGLAELSASLPMRFEQNVGQVKEPAVRYFARGRGYRLALGEAAAAFTLDGDAQPAERTVRLRLAGGAKHPVLVGIDPLLTQSNYFFGSDSRAWRTGVASFAGVRYEGVYPGTDLVFSGNDRRLEQSFFLAAGARPQRIRLVYEGAAAAAVGKAGELILHTPGGDLTADRPVAYQTAEDGRRPVACRYELLARTAGAPVVGFVTGEYDRRLPLVIDPLFGSSTILGGTGRDVGRAVGVDGAGNIYIAGGTASADFLGTILPGGEQPANQGGFDGFVVKLDPTGTTMLYSTYLGGSDTDEVEGIAVDPAGNAYVTGYTFSVDFPGVTARSLQRANAGDRDAFVVKLSPSGSALLYATYLGGRGSDLGYGVAIDAAGNAYVAGSTGSADFPGVTASSLQPAFAGGGSDAFVARINAAGTAISYATYLGTSGDDQAYGLAVDAAGEALIAGATCSAAFPVTAGSLARLSPGADCGAFLYDGFVAKLSASGTRLIYSTFLGGEGNDVARALALDAAGNAYVTGFSRSTGFTGLTASAFQRANPGGYAAFLTKINAAGTAAEYSTFLGGGGSYAWAVAVDSAANAYVTGGSGAGYPVVNGAALQPSFTRLGSRDGFVTKVDATGAVVYSTYMMGGTNTGYAVAVDSQAKSVYLAGSWDSSDGDAFLAQVVPSGALSIVTTADVSIVDPGSKISYTLAYHNYGEVEALAASLNETVPADSVFVPSSSTPGWICLPDTAAGSACVLARDTVPAAGGGAASFTVRVKTKLSIQGGQITNTACAQPGANCDTIATETTAAPVLSIAKTASFTEAKPGSVLRYTITVSNSGNQDASSVRVTDTVPGNSVFDPAVSTAGWSCTPNSSAGAVCSFLVAVLAAGGRVNLTFAADLATTFSNTACVQIVDQPPEIRALKGLKALPPLCATATTPLK